MSKTAATIKQHTAGLGFRAEMMGGTQWRRWEFRVFDLATDTVLRGYYTDGDGLGLYEKSYPMDRLVLGFGEFDATTDDATEAALRFIRAMVGGNWLGFERSMRLAE